MTMHTIVGRIPREYGDRFRNSIDFNNRSEWFRSAVRCFFNPESFDSRISARVPDCSSLEKFLMFPVIVGDDLYLKIRETSEETGEPMYSITGRIIVMRLLMEEGTVAEVSLGEDELRVLHERTAGSFADYVHHVLRPEGGL